MKNKRLIITAVTAGLFAGLLSSCMDNFLDKPAHNMTPSVSLNDPIKLSSSVYGAILTLSEGQGDAFSTMGEIASDNALRGSILSDAGNVTHNRLYNQFQNFYGIAPSSTNFINDIWTASYKGIDRTNTNIRALNSYFDEFMNKYKNGLIAENRVVRAFFYMTLVNTFGEVVILPEEGDITPAEYARLTNDKSVTQLYDYIVEDLRQAVKYIPTKQEWKELYGIDWQGHAHMGTAQGLLAKALLYQAANELYFNHHQEKAEKCYQEIVEIVKAMEEDYPLHGNFEEIFRRAGNYCSESLFEIGTESTANGDTRFAGWRPSQPRSYSGYGRVAPTLNLINQYEKNNAGEIIDARYFGTVLFGVTNPLSGMVHPGNNSPFRKINGDLINGVAFNNKNLLAAGWPNRYSRKAAQEKPISTSNTPQTNLGGSNLKLLRMGEVLPVGAEAAHYAGEYGLAVKWLNLVRKRANLEDSPVTSGTALLEQIWKDKRLEIALEWSNRYYELVRIDKLNPGYMMDAMNAKVNDEFNGIEQHLNNTNGWNAINKPNFPITQENFRTLIPLCNKLEVPRNYTMPIPTTVLSDMLNVKQTQYYR